MTTQPPRAQVHHEDGMTTAEYAVGTLAACAFAAVMYEVVTSGAVRSLVLGLVTKALGSVS
jgi:anti-sigma-K factor RskA